MHAATRQINHSRRTLRRAWLAAAAGVACLIFSAAFDRIGAQSPAPALSGRVVGEILWLDEVLADDRSRVGAKAFTLARLRRAGLPVPDGFVLLAGDGSLEGMREADLSVCPGTY